MISCHNQFDFNSEHSDESKVIGDDRNQDMLADENWVAIFQTYLSNQMITFILFQSNL